MMPNAAAPAPNASPPNAAKTTKPTPPRKPTAHPPPDPTPRRSKSMRSFDPCSFGWPPPMSPIPAARIEFRDSALDRRDPSAIDTPGLIDVDTFSRSHRTHCSPGAATSDHARTVLRSCSSAESNDPRTPSGAPHSGW
jgi:hypothetical protein